MNDYARNHIMYPVVGELAHYGYRRYIRPHLKKMWDYKALSSPLILSQKNNNMPTVPRNKAAKGGPKSVQIGKVPSNFKNTIRRLDYHLQKTKMLNTPGGGKMRMRRLGAVHSRSAGIIRRLRKVKRRGRKRKNLFLGVEKTVEAYKNEATTSQCLHFGHGTSPRNQVLEIAWKAIIKSAVRKLGVNINAWDDIATPFANTAVPSWRITCQINTNNVVTTAAAYAPAQNSTYQDIITWFIDPARPWYDSTVEVILDNIQFLPVDAGGATIFTGLYGRYSLRNCRVTVEVKSCMKMQNRSVNTAGNVEADDIDNVPLYGKTYEFLGTGLLRPKMAGDAIVAINQNSGYYAPFDAGNYKEPIDALYYDKVKKAGKVKLEPGEIKTSYLYTKKTLFISTLCKMMALQEANANPTIPLGKNRMFSLEKMIDTLADPNPNGLGISVALEVNNRYRCVAKTFNDTKTNPTFARITA